MERMSTLDAGFFFVEDENTPMHVGSVAVFDGPPPSYGDVVRLLAARLSDVPRYRQRVRTVPLHLGRPVWTDDPHFEILYHIRHSAVPGPGGAEQLRNLAGRVFAQRLDMTKPLWEMYLVEGLRESRWALISKVHHCMIDGVAGADLTATLLQASPDERIPAPLPWTPALEPSTTDLLVDGVRDVVRTPLRQLARVPSLAGNLLSGAELMAYGRGLPGTARRLGRRTHSSLNGPSGPHRRWEWTQASLSEVKGIRTALGGTVNDVVLAAITRGFRDLLAGRNELIEGQVVRSLVPVSVRSEAERGVLNNRVSAVMVNLPVGQADAEQRLQRIREQMDDIKNTRQAVGAQALTELAGFAAPTLLALGSRLSFRFPQPLLQTVTTNVPGPRVPLFMLGRRLVELHPYVPIASNIRTSIGIMSYLDQLNFGINADFDGVPDINVLRDGIRAGVDELLALAAAGAPEPIAAKVTAKAGPRSPTTAPRAPAKATKTPSANGPGPSEHTPAQRTTARPKAAEPGPVKAGPAKTRRPTS
jgi:WS/DGAT/MGAT family acyltransferase